MQKIYLHIGLLIFLAIGCGGRDHPIVNNYVAGNKAFVLGFAKSEGHPFLPAEGLCVSPSPWWDANIGLGFSLGNHSTDRAMAVWEKRDGEGEWQVMDMEDLVVNRSLTSLSFADTGTGLTQYVLPLPNGDGIAFYLEGESTMEYSLMTAFSADILPGDGGDAETIGDRLALLPLKDGRTVAVATGKAAKVERADEPRGSWRIHVQQSRRRQIILVIADKSEDARQTAERYRGWKRQKLERAVQDSLSGRMRFRLNTADDRLNRCFALLASSLSGIQTSCSSQQQLEAAAIAAPALYLAFSEKPDWIFSAESSKGAGGMVIPPQGFRFRWGADAFRASMKWGMFDDASLQQCGRIALAEAQKIEHEMAENPHALDGDPGEGATDTLALAAEGHLRFAHILDVGADFASMRSDRNEETRLRAASVMAGREGRKYLSRSATRWLNWTKSPFAPSTESPEEDEATAPVVPDFLWEAPPLAPPLPDSSRFLEGAAKYGFNWAGNDQKQIGQFALRIGELPLFSPYRDLAWLRWTAYRFDTDPKLTETPDLDSLCLLVDRQDTAGAWLSQPFMPWSPPANLCVAFENLCTVYLGVHPDWGSHRISLVPRLPASWGHTTARVPFGPGFLLLDYDFLHDRATIALSEIEPVTDVLFSYPLSDGATRRIQFKLGTDRPAVLVKLRRDSRGEAHIELEDSTWE